MHLLREGGDTHAKARVFLGHMPSNTDRGRWASHIQEQRRESRVGSRRRRRDGRGMIHAEGEREGGIAPAIDARSEVYGATN